MDLASDRGEALRRQLGLAVDPDAKVTGIDALPELVSALSLALDAAIAARGPRFLVGPDSPYMMTDGEITAVLNTPPLVSYKWKSLRDVMAALDSELPVGGRAIVVTQVEAGSGHAFNALKGRKGIRLMDAGLGETYRTPEEVDGYQDTLESTETHGPVTKINVYFTTSAERLIGGTFRPLILEWRAAQHTSSAAPSQSSPVLA